MDFLLFRQMIAPVVLQVVFWIGVVLCLIFGFIAMGQGGEGIVGGLMLIFFGPLLTRVYCEFLIVIFRIHETLKDIRNAGLGYGGQGPGMPQAPMPTWQPPMQQPGQWPPRPMAQAPMQPPGQQPMQQPYQRPTQPVQRPPVQQPLRQQPPRQQQPRQQPPQQPMPPPRQQ